MNKKTKKEQKLCRVEALSDHFTAEITKEYKNGEAQLTVTYDDYFKEFIKKFYGKKVCTKKMVEKFVRDGIDYGIRRYENIDILTEE